MDDHDDGLGPMGQGSGDESRSFAYDTDREAPPAPPNSDPPPPALDDEPTEPYEPIEPLNPWISIVTRPRETIRYILTTGVWNNWIGVYSILYLMSVPPVIVNMLAQPDSMQSLPIEDFPMEIPVAAFMGIVMLIFMVFGYPIALLMVMLMAWLYKIVGGWLGGQGTTAEVRTAFVWGSVVGTYFQYVGMAPNLFGAVYYQVTDEINPVVTLALMAVSFFLMLPLTIYAVMVSSKALGEAHQFSAWRGFGTILLTAIGMMAAVFCIVIGSFVIFLVLAAAAG